jgi:predicted ATPase
MLQLEAALAGACSGAGRLVVLRGEAGIGKTLIAEMFAERARSSGCLVARCDCREQRGTPPLWPFIELLRSLASAAGTAPAHPAAGDLDTARPTHKLFDAVAQTLADLITPPLVLILDDLQDADDASIELLRYLLPEIARMRILIVATLRNGHAQNVQDTPLSAAIVHRNCVRIQVTALEPSDVASYLVSQLGAVDRALCQKVYELSEGHPQCMVELVKQLREQSTLDAAALRIPPRLCQQLCQRLASLSGEARAVLIDAAVLGLEFGLPLLAAVTERCPATLMDVLASACAADLVRPLAASSTEFRFKHGLLRAALYEELTPAERRARHVRTLLALEQRPSLVYLPCAELAYHAAAALPCGDLRKAVEYCEQAANVAERMHAFSDAARYLRDAREALDLIEDASPQERFQLLFRQALLAHPQGGPVQQKCGSGALHSAGTPGERAHAEAGPDHNVSVQ